MRYDDVIRELRDFWAAADARQADPGDCPNRPDEDGSWPCDPKGYFGVVECQTCGRIGVMTHSRPEGDA